MGAQTWNPRTTQNRLRETESAIAPQSRPVLNQRASGFLPKMVLLAMGSVLRRALCLYEN